MLLVENVGAYIDIPAPPDWLVVHVWLERERLVLQPDLVDALTAVAHTPSTP